ncbi:MAG TPA: substrate-binding domain-containing protein [Terriglobales bacterium]|nr:substrate-binding domain-containing protein [Terriglobales bacterium]
MNGSKILFSLTTKDNDYQRAQAASIETVAKRMGAQIEIIYADNDSVNQSQQLLSAIQKKNHGLAAVISEPVGTGMVQVAETAAKAGIAWGILNRTIDYAARLRQSCGVPVFEVDGDQETIGHIHAAQLAKLVPGGGSVLYIEGPTAGSAAKLRTQGIVAQKPANIELKMMKGNWTEESAQRAVTSWLKLRTSRSADFVAVVAQDDSMAMGARKAFSALTDAGERTAWLSLPHLGCDGTPEAGQQFVRRGQLAATVVYPLTAGIALEIYLKAKASGAGIPERTLAAPTSYPSIDALRPAAVTQRA